MAMACLITSIAITLSSRRGRKRHRCITGLAFSFHHRSASRYLLNQAVVLRSALENYSPAVVLYNISLDRFTMAGGEGRNMGTKRKASEAAEGKGVVTSKVDQPVMTDRLEEMTELCDLQVVDGQQLMPSHCEAERLVCDEIAEDTDEDSDLDDVDAITGVLQKEIPARWRSGEITDEEAIKFHIELANLWRSREITDEEVFEYCMELANLWRSGEIADEEVFEYYTELANWRSGEITDEEFGEITDEEFFAYYKEMINLMSNENDHESSSI